MVFYCWQYDIQMKEFSVAQEITVLGAGMVGVSVAWHLQQRGYAVRLVDRRAPGEETSYGNAGIIQREAVRPYAFPRDLSTLLRVAPNRAVDIRYRPLDVLKSARPLFGYWQSSAAGRYAKIQPQYAALIQQALETHEKMIQAAGAEHLIRREGYLEVFRTTAALEAEAGLAEQDQQYGVEYQLLDQAALAQCEPHLSTELKGAIHWTQPWTARDPAALVKAYAADFVRAGGELVKADIQSICRQGQQWEVSTGQQKVSSEQLVIALGPWSAHWLARLGLHVPLFSKRGYHMHYASEHPLHHWVMDAEVGYLLAPMQAGIRLTSGAELSGLETAPNFAQLAAAEQVARGLFPLGERLEATPWFGSRPCLPDMKPVIGPVASQTGLWTAFGHGHQGFTLGPLTGQLIGQMMEKEPTAISMAPYALERFCG